MLVLWQPAMTPAVHPKATKFDARAALSGMQARALFDFLITLVANDIPCSSMTCGNDWSSWWNIGIMELRTPSTWASK